MVRVLARADFRSRFFSNTPTAILPFFLSADTHTARGERDNWSACTRDGDFGTEDGATRYSIVTFVLFRTTPKVCAEVHPTPASRASTGLRELYMAHRTRGA